MNTIQSTIYGLEDLIYMLLGHTPIIDEFSTVNERLSIAGNARPVAGEAIRLGVLTCGNKGHRHVPGEDGIALTSVRDHLATHASVYGPVPLAIRPVDEDFTLSQRERYCLRKEISHGGQNWYAYYGFYLNITPDDVQVIKTKITKNEDGTTTIEPFTPNNTDLYPPFVELPEVGAVTTSNVKVSVKATIRVAMDPVFIENFVEAMKIMHNGDERYAIFSEFALCTGAKRMMTVNSSSGPINFTESIGTRIYTFSMDHRVVYYNTQDLTVDFELGNQLPLLGAASIPTLETIP